MKNIKWSLVIILAVLGTIAKGVGWIVYGSITLMIDTLTCIANLAALIGVIYFSRYIGKRADKRHPYGHFRLSLTGSYIVLLTYSFIAGISVAELLYSKLGSQPGEGAVYMSLAGLVFYAPLPVILKDRKDPLGVYGIFTFSEILESLVSITMVTLSVTTYPIFDYLGGSIILGFIIYEIYHNSKEYLKLTTDTAPPNLVEDLAKKIRDHLNLEVKTLRIREVFPGIYQGDIVITVPEGYDIVEAHKLADEVEKIGKEYGTELIVHIEPGEYRDGRCR